MSEFVVSMRRVTKRFGEFTALDGVDLNVRPQTIHAIVGENGAGKTTLMRVLYGAIRPEAGEVLLDGAAVQFRNSAEAIASGIGMVSQHYAIIGELSCLDNLILGAEPGAVIAPEAAKARATELADRMGFTFDWDAEASTLSPGGAQKLEILKLLWRNARIMILDEPTAMLSPADADALFESLARLAREGATILLVTHRLPEVLEHSAHVTVLRGGKLVADRPVEGVSAADLAEMIVGHALRPPPERTPPGEAPDVLAVDGVTVQGARGDDAVKAASLRVRQGEIVGIAGVDGSGQRELVHAICGISPTKSGRIALGGADVTGASTRDRLDAGLRLIAEDRHEEAVVEDWSLVENGCLGYQRRPEVQKGGWIQPEPLKQMAQDFADRFHTKRESLSAAMASLSGGNQQRFVAARAMAFAPRVIVAFQPARGLDIDATRNVYDGLRAACAEGAGALVVSFDLDELLENCDRVVAMNGGVLYEPKPGEERDRAAIGCLMVGAS
ncbi:MAG: ABC transporter ATP-binding protein [Fimbriimonadales bacterium]